MTTSEQLFKQAQQSIPGGVNSPVRAFNGVGGTPVFFKQGCGAHVIDVDDKKYIDYVGSWGPLVMGHAHPEVITAVEEKIKLGLSFGAPTEIEIQCAEKVLSLLPHMESIRMVNSGTEATMTAIRLARGYTGKNKIIKFEGCYHGHSDGLLVKAGSGALTLGTPSSPGIPNPISQETLIAQFNNLDSIQSLFSKYSSDIAGIIIEPVAGNMGCIPPQPGFLQALKDLCEKHNSLLIFDEVMTGFRVDLHCAQGLYNIKPDLCTLGKVIGGGMPVGAVAGPKTIMEQLAPTGPIYQAGTLSGNPIAMTAGLATLELLSQPEQFQKLKNLTKQLVYGIHEIAKAKQVPLVINQVGSMFSLFFTEQNNVCSYEDVMACDAQKYKQFFHGMLEQGVYFAPSAYETAFMSCAHTQEDIEKTLSAMSVVFADLAH